METKELQGMVWDTSVQHGFENPPLDIASKLMLIVSELGEAYEEIRNGHSPFAIRIPSNGDKPEGVPIELADAIIRLFNLLSALEVDVEQVVLEKDAYNRTRPYKHGKEF